MAPQIPGYSHNEDDSSSYFYGDCQWPLEKAYRPPPRVRFGNATQKSATFTYYRVEDASAAGELRQGQGGFEPTTVVVPAGEYKDVKLLSKRRGSNPKLKGIFPIDELIFGFRGSLEVIIGVVEYPLGDLRRARGTLQRLDVRNVSPSMILVLRPPRLKKPPSFRAIEWPCTAEDICQGARGRTRKGSKAGWNSKARQYAKEGHSGTDRLGYGIYATALAGLFSMGNDDVLPAAVGIYAPWGGGKSFLLGNLKALLQQKREVSTGLATWFFFCITGPRQIITRSALFVIGKAILKALCKCCCACSERAHSEHHDEESGGGKEPSVGRDFIVIEFNAWECAGSDVLWAAVITKIFDAVEGHLAFGRGAVRAARINELLVNGSWSWCGIATFYVAVAVLGIITLCVLHWTGVVAGINKAVGWILATLVPGGLTLLKLLLEMRSRGFLGTAQSVLRKAISKRESVGESYLGFMADVKEELKILFGMINIYNKGVEEENARGAWFPQFASTAIKLKKKPKKKLALTVIVDDLDRCPKEKVMEMLKATHLLLEHPQAPLAVFLAVDPQLIVAAIAESLDGVPNTMKALQYLDKIIHLPFCIPPMSETKRLNLLETLLNGKDNSCPVTLQRLKKCLEWMPQKEDMDGRKADHRLQGLLQDIPDALELMCFLDYCKSTALDDESSQFPSSAMKQCCDDLEALDSTLPDHEPACVNLLEALNREVNKWLPGDNSPLSLKNQPTAFTSALEGDVGSSPEDAVSGGENGTQAPNKTLDGTPSSDELQFRNVSWEENETFITLFRAVKATPRKIKRVVNVFFLQRYLAQVQESNARELITWTVLAEFWPFRLSCIAFAMLDMPPKAVGASSRVMAMSPTADVSCGDNDVRDSATPAQAGLGGGSGPTDHAAPEGSAPLGGDAGNPIFPEEGSVHGGCDRVDHARWAGSTRASRAATRAANTAGLSVGIRRLSSTRSTRRRRSPPAGAGASALDALLSEDDPTIASVYSGSTGSSSVRNWIEAHRHRAGNTKDLCSSDDSEARFLEVMRKGAQITRTQVIDTLLRNSFNLNPAILSVVEAEMAETPSCETKVAKLRLSSELYELLQNNKESLAKARSEGADPGEITCLEAQQRKIWKAMEKDAEEEL